MKKNIKHVSKRMLAIILTTMIIMSTMLVGTFSVNAATIDDNSVSAGYTIYVASSISVSQLEAWYDGLSGDLTYPLTKTNKIIGIELYILFL